MFLSVLSASKVQDLAQIYDMGHDVYLWGRDTYQVRKAHIDRDAMRAAAAVAGRNSRVLVHIPASRLACAQLASDAADFLWSYWKARAPRYQTGA